MKFFVTGVNGQLGHDVMNELSSRSYEGIGSDIAPKYSGIQDDSPVTKMPYISFKTNHKLTLRQENMISTFLISDDIYNDSISIMKLALLGYKITLIFPSSCPS